MPGTLTIAIPDRYLTPVNTTLAVAAPGILAVSGGSAAAITKAPQGSLTVQPNGAFKYVPKSGFRGTDAFTYRATVNGVVVTTTVTIYVLGSGMSCTACNLSASPRRRCY